MSDKPVKFESDAIKASTIEQQETLLDNEALLNADDKNLPVTSGNLKLKPQQKKQSWSRYFWRSFAALVVAGATYEAWQFIQASFSINPLLGWGVTALTALTLVAGVGALIKGRIKSRRLKRRLKLQKQLEALEASDSYGQSLGLLEQINDEIIQEVDISQALANFEQQKSYSHNDKELLQIYSNQVLSGLDRLAMDAISKHASESAVMVALSPLAAADMALVAWRSSKMLQEISRIYGCPQNVFGRFGLTKQVATNLMLAGASELVADAGVELLGKSLTATISGKVAQGIGVGILIARLGIQTMKLCRPMQFDEDSQPRLSQLRKLISERVLSIVKTKNSAQSDKPELAKSESNKAKRKSS
ncbi:YcjF family protein [Kangiella sp. TOML190]|uniref:YcjF family protein n=1 Tax=Kangiella sp. TOML190 TaxID=2931351 RepID=UPI00203AA7E1|nr:TIGR01620 family protein [Kangiella sp. TOML190]